MTIGLEQNAIMDVVDDTDTAGTEMPGKILNPHAYHLNLPPHHMDKNGVPYITKFAEKKVRLVLELAHSIELTEELFVRPAQDSQEENYGDDDDEGDYGFPKQHNTMVSESTVAFLLFVGKTISEYFVFSPLDRSQIFSQFTHIFVSCPFHSCSGNLSNHYHTVSTFLATCD